MQDLIIEYKKSLKQLRTIKAYDELEGRLITEMISDMEYAIEWMKTGQRPNQVSRSQESKSAYDRCTLINLDLFPCLEIKPSEELTLEKKKAVMQVLNVLTERQLTCFLLYAAHMRSMEEIAEELNIKKATVQDHIETARKKIKKIADKITD